MAVIGRALLRQPGGFTGLDSVREPLQAKDLPVPNRGDEPLIELDLSAAPHAARVGSQMGQDFVGPGINALDLDRPLEAVADPHVEVPGSLATSHATLGPIADGHDFELLIVDREPGVPVAPQKGFFC